MSNNLSGSKIKLSEKIKSFFYRFIHYIGIVFAIVVACYVFYVFVPEFLKFCKNFLIELIKADYPNLSK